MIFAHHMLATVLGVCLDFEILMVLTAGERQVSYILDLQAHTPHANNREAVTAARLVDKC
jgi:hypothetical protein